METQTGNNTLVTFQVAKPVVVPTAKEGEGDCVHTMVLMKHVFAFSYGKPFVGTCVIWFILTVLHTALSL